MGVDVTMGNSLASTDEIRSQIRDHYLGEELSVLRKLAGGCRLTSAQRERISDRAAHLIRRVRSESKPSIMESFLAEYGLTTEEGVALMCLAEALLRVPDARTLIDLIEDKIGSGSWDEHAGQAASPLVNTATWGLMAAARLLGPSDPQRLIDHLRALVRRLGDPVIRSVAQQAMKEMGRQFVLGRTISEAQRNGRSFEARGYRYSYDMLGEAAQTGADANAFYDSYASAIEFLATKCNGTDIRENPGISVKLSALHPRYEYGQRERVMAELVPRVLALAIRARQANMGFNVDAEEADRLDLSLDVIEAVLSNPALAGWGGFGVVVQAYGQRASFVLDWLYALAQGLDRKIMVRLVKGAYWDAEIKRAQVLGLDGFPVYTHKLSSDVSYIACGEKLLAMTDHIYPQFATHNAHSVAAILEMAGSADEFEFQRLHGMGESLYEAVLSESTTRCRIYAPVGAHKELLAYLVRRLLENGANSSFVNQIVDSRIAPETIATDPFALMNSLADGSHGTGIVAPAAIFGRDRQNSQGWDLTEPETVQTIEALRGKFRKHQWRAAPMILGTVEATRATPVVNPADHQDQVGTVIEATGADIATAFSAAGNAWLNWSRQPVAARVTPLLRFADLLESHAAEIFALLTRESGKTLMDGIAELREAVDFARYYANQARHWDGRATPSGTVVCVSPWNFPLAIFAGQIVANLAAGNTVIAKPAPQTPLVAARAVELMYEAGIPHGVIQLLPGGAEVGQLLSKREDVAGLCFTGSTATAQVINRNMAEHAPPDAFLVAETGGLNAMVIDSTALPEQVVRDVIASSFQSAGQRCSALRVLYLQKDIAPPLLEMLYGAMDELTVGNPWELSSDVGPIIDEAAQRKIDRYVAMRGDEGRVRKALNVLGPGWFTGPTVIELDDISQLDEEIFGPVLHVISFEADDLDAVVEAINNKGFGLTFGMHSRVNSRINYLSRSINVGNIYVNRNQIGAIVGSQPFGGEGLSGTGPKAGGPHYLRRMMRSATLVPTESAPTTRPVVDLRHLQAAIDSVALLEATDGETRVTQLRPSSQSPLISKSHELPGPTGENNVLSYVPRGTILCLGPTAKLAMAQALAALNEGNRVVLVSPDGEKATVAAKETGLPIIGINGAIAPSSLAFVSRFAAVVCNGDETLLRAYRCALAEREGPIIPLITEYDCAARFVLERHVCTDTTAAGGNASLLANGTDRIPRP